MALQRWGRTACPKAGERTDRSISARPTPAGAPGPRGTAGPPPVHREYRVRSAPAKGEPSFEKSLMPLRGRCPGHHFWCFWTDTGFGQAPLLVFLDRDARPYPAANLLSPSVFLLPRKARGFPWVFFLFPSPNALPRRRLLRPGGPSSEAPRSPARASPVSSPPPRSRRRGPRSAAPARAAAGAPAGSSPAVGRDENGNRNGNGNGTGTGRRHLTGAAPRRRAEPSPAEGQVWGKLRLRLRDN